MKARRKRIRERKVKNRDSRRGKDNIAVIDIQNQQRKKYRLPTFIIGKISKQF